MHLKQPRVTYSAYGPFAKNKERIQKFKGKADTSYIYKNEIHKTCFQHDMTYGDFKDLERRIASDKFLREKAFNIAKNPKYDGYQRRLVSIDCFYTFFDEKSKGSCFNIEVKHNEQLAEELQKPIIRKFKKRTFYSRSKDYIWAICN